MSGTINQLFQPAAFGAMPAAPNVLGPQLGNAASIYGSGPPSGATMLYDGGPTFGQLQQFAGPQAQLPSDPLALAQLAGQLQDRNWYAPQQQGGGFDPSGTALAFGFPSFQDPRLTQDHLAQMAQNGVPGAMDAFQRLLRQASAPSIGGGEGEMGSGGGGAGASGGGAGQASGAWG